MPVSASNAQKLFARLAADRSQSFEMDWYSGPRASLMTGRPVQNGVDRDDIGHIMIWAPPASLYSEDTQRPMMFSDMTLKPNLSLGQSMQKGDYLFCCREDNGSAFIEVLNRDGSPIHRPGSQGAAEVVGYQQGIGDKAFYDNHVGPTLRVGDAKNEQIMVIDPSLFDEPVAPDSWKNQQNCAASVLFHARRDCVLWPLVQDSAGQRTIEAISEKRRLADPMAGIVPA